MQDAPTPDDASGQATSPKPSEPTLFERIVARELPADVVYEDAEILAFRDIAPKAPTHVLVIPKKPIPSLAHATDADELLLGRLMTVARKVAEAEGLSGGYRCVLNTGEDGGQEVPHLHLHVLGGRKIGGFPGVS